MQVGYPVSALSFDPQRKVWSLAPDFDPGTMLWRLVQTEDGAELRDALDRPITSGIASSELPLLLRAASGRMLRLERIDIDGQPCLFIASEPLASGADYAELPHPATAGRAAGPEEIARLPALGPGTMIATADGPQAIDWLRPGDEILTRDHGLRPLVWLGHHVMPLRAPAVSRPLRISAAAFGPTHPEHETIASPGLGILLAGPELKFWFTEGEMFGRVAEICTAPRLEGRQSLYTLLFDAPEIVLANGIWVSSVQLDAAYAALLPAELRMTLRPRLAEAHAEAARSWLERWEVEMFCRARNARRRVIAA